MGYIRLHLGKLFFQFVFPSIVQYLLVLIFLIFKNTRLLCVYLWYYLSIVYTYCLSFTIRRGGSKPATEGPALLLLKFPAKITSHFKDRNEFSCSTVQENRLIAA